MEVENKFFYQTELEKMRRVDPAEVLPDGSIIFVSGKFTVDDVKKLAERYQVSAPYLVCDISDSLVASPPPLSSL